MVALLYEALTLDTPCGSTGRKGLKQLESNITVNAIAPDYVVTDLTAGMRKSEKISKSLLQRNPSKRFGLAEEISNAALYLASEGASMSHLRHWVVDKTL